MGIKKWLSFTAKKKDLFKISLFLATFLSLGAFLFSPALCRALEPGALLYRTSAAGKMFGYSGDPLLYAENGILKDIFPGHVGIYVGRENGEDYVVEALADGIVKMPAKYFVDSGAGEKYLGAKLPRSATVVERAKVVAIAKSLVGKKLGYDFDFKKQKGPSDGEWTCVGLAEKIYESADISNPENLGALEYDPDYYAVDVTPDGFDNYSVINSAGDCFSKEREFSKIARRKDLLLPAPELIGFDAGLEHEGERYVFLPYTQFLQPTLKDVSTDITITSDFNGEAVRGKVPVAGIVLRWSLINNPLSSLATLVKGAKEAVINLAAKIFSGGSGDELVLNEEETGSTAADSKGQTAAESSGTVPATSRVSVNKADPAALNAAKRAAEEAAKAEATKKDKEREKEPASLKKIIPPDSKNDSETALAGAKVNKAAAATSTAAEEENQTLENVANNSAATSTVAETNAAATTNGNNTANTAITSSASGGPPSPPPLALLNRVYATDDDDWVEIFNPNDYDFDLAAAGYRLEKTKTAEDSTILIRLGNSADGAYPGGTVIEAGGKYLIVGAEASSYYKNQADAIATRDSFGWTGKDYTLYLGTAAISSSADADIVDAVGFGPGATYYLGSGPAPEIADYYILERVAVNDDNRLDYVLTYTDDPDAPPETPVEEDNATTTDDENTDENTEATNENENGGNSGNQNLALPLPFPSEGLSHLWHFDACYGAAASDEMNDNPNAALTAMAPWAIGKWGCAQTVGYQYPALSAALSPKLESGNFSLSFRYRSSSEFPRLALKLFNADDEETEFILDPNRLAVSGLPNSQSSAFSGLPFDDAWHQLAVVVNEAEDYWAFYVDGEEREWATSTAVRPQAERLEIKGDNGPALIDELAFWPRPLSAEEIAAAYQADAPFYPPAARPLQAEAALVHFWNFNEGTGTTTADQIGSADLHFSAGLWSENGAEGRSLISVFQKDVNLGFPAMADKDLSLAFWWKNSAYPNEGRVKIGLRSGEKDQLVLVASDYRVGFFFNGQEGIFSEGAGNFLPADGLWHHLTLTYNSYVYRLRFYVDGEEKAARPFIWLKNGEEPDGLIIRNENWTAEIDGLGVWTGVLSSEEITALWEGE